MALGRLLVYANLGIMGTIMTIAAAGAAEITVLGSPGTRAPYTQLLPGFEAATGHKVTTAWDGVSTLTKRVAGGETADVIMLPSAQIDELTKLGKLIPGAKVNVASSGIGVAIRAGAPKIDIGSPEAVRSALIAAKTIGVSTGPSGVHIKNLIAKWGLADQLQSKFAPYSPSVPVGEMLARGDAEIGFQQVSELLPVKGIDLLGPLPPGIQETTVFSAAVHVSAGQGDGKLEAARALLKYLTAPEAAETIRKAGMEPGP